MRRKSGIVIIFSLFILCAFVALAKNNLIEKQGFINGNGGFFMAGDVLCT